MNNRTWGYWYLHTNGSRIWKPIYVVGIHSREVRNYFDSPFVVEYWQDWSDDNRTPQERRDGKPINTPKG